MKSYTLQEINAIVKGEVVGDTNNTINSPETIEKANKNQITIIGSNKFIKKWDISKASIAIVNEKLDVSPKENRAIIKVKNADLSMAKLLEIFNPSPPVFEEDIHHTAVIHPTAMLGTGCKVGAGCYIGKNVVLGDNTRIYPNVTIMDDTKIGSETIVWPGTVIRERCEIGSNCIFHNNVSIGADGFGFRPSDDGTRLIKIPQIGNVVIGNYVEIGSNSCVDRGKYSSTIIGDGTKIDNLIQIGHNSILGRSCIMAGQSGVAGSVTLGDGVVVGGSASISDHVTVNSGATVGGGSGVMNDVPAGKTVLGYPASDSRETLKQWIALRKLAKK